MKYWSYQKISNHALKRVGAKARRTLAPLEGEGHTNVRQRITRFVLAVFLVSLASSAHSANDSLLRGLVAGCIDAQERLHQRPLTNDDKRNILNFCYCKAPNLAALVPDAASRQKLLMQDSVMMAAVARIDAACIEGVKSGRRFYPSPK